MAMPNLPSTKCLGLAVRCPVLTVLKPDEVRYLAHGYPTIL